VSVKHQTAGMDNSNGVLPIYADGGSNSIITMLYEGGYIPEPSVSFVLNATQGKLFIGG
jgi:hypothetical protein